MTDLPDEGVVVLAFNGQHFGFARCRDGKWYTRFGEKEIAPPDLWVPLPIVRAAREMAEAAQASLRQCACFNGRERTDGPYRHHEHFMDCHTHALATALRNAGMGGGK